MNHSWHSLQRIRQVHDKFAKQLFNHAVQVQEKIDGSFFAFGAFTEDPGDPDSTTFTLRTRSKGASFPADAPPSMFKGACQTVIEKRDLLVRGWTYRGEVLAKPKHNVLAYDRVPKGNIILFDILSDQETYVPYTVLQDEAQRLDLECVPQLAFYNEGELKLEVLRGFFTRDSILGSQKIEGVVVKPLARILDPDGKLLMMKFVSEDFKEVKDSKSASGTPGAPGLSKDIITTLANKYTTKARWNKAIQHLRESGQITDSPKDIGLLMREVPADVFRECEAEMKDLLWDWAKKHVTRELTLGLPEWYKEILLNNSFEGVESTPLETKNATTV